MEVKTRKQIALPYLCNSCGHYGESWFDGDNPKGKCEKCSKTVWGMNLKGTMQMVYVLNKEVRVLRDSVLDLECYIERLEETTYD